MIQSIDILQDGYQINYLDEYGDEELNQYIGEDAYKPFRYYTGDFVVRFFGTTPQTWQQNRIKIKNYYDQNREFFDSRGLPLSHPYNRPGNIPVAKLASLNFDIEELRQRQMVTKVTLIE